MGYGSSLAVERFEVEDQTTARRSAVDASCVMSRNHNDRIVTSLWSMALHRNNGSFSSGSSLQGRSHGNLVYYTLEPTGSASVVEY